MIAAANVCRAVSLADHASPVSRAEPAVREQYSLSRERIRQLQERALGKIQRELERRERRL